ncbi:proline racemase family protein [Arthrobacter sp. A2-55]|uniref:proline racemase family protein n=1 Tax=Arthrobacter sp. A2-55 TaxID=2897337 RepID=UPI0021CDA7D9|nr:proline racemase family protein [Arthrobacter sp. A2-55]MCU6482410.1 proline racemase family protein [Arthrobacter sp. A2-55]
MKVESWEIETVDYHTAGEPFRIVPALPFLIPGATVLERRENAMAGDADKLRRLLVNEPRGHADMYGGFIVPPNDDGAHFGVLFWHKDGFSTACGHGTIALGAWAVRSGLVRAPDDGDTDVVIDVPSGRVTARVSMVDGVVESVTFRNVPSYVVARDIEVKTSDFGRLRVDVLWGGALYASLPARAAGLDVTPSNLFRLISAGRQVKAALADHPAAHHPTDTRLDGIYGTIFHEAVGPDSGLAMHGALAQRNVTIFADGQVDRSPCGSGTAARVAALTDSGELAYGDVLDHFSIIDSHFTSEVAGHSDAGVVVEVTGRAFPVGECKFTLEADDELGLGFVLR